VDAEPFAARVALPVFAQDVADQLNTFVHDSADCRRQLGRDVSDLRLSGAVIDGNGVRVDRIVRLRPESERGTLREASLGQCLWTVGHACDVAEERAGVGSLVLGLDVEPTVLVDW